ncbi:MAG: translocation/assembly module TamB domain-containing protein [Deltaproteobacteria bacterium]|nr:translocation/assembly module TamB domain-containing protein [Deltaproteobacteria bacterium]
MHRGSQAVAAGPQESAPTPIPPAPGERGQVATAGTFRRLLEASLLGAAALALLMSLSILHVRLPAGRRAAGRLIETLARDEIAGELRIGNIDSLATDRLVVRDLELADAQGRPVLHVARAEGRIDLAALWERRVRVVDLAIRRPRAFLIEGDRGVPTLVRALEPRVRRPPSAGPPPFVVELDDGYVRDGRVEGSVAGGLVIDLRQIDGRASFVIDGVAPQLAIAWSRMKLLAPLPQGAAAADFRLAGSAVIRGPGDGGPDAMPTRIDARGRLSWTAGSAQVRFGLAGPRLTLGVTLPRGTPAESIRAIVPGYPFSSELGGWATASGSVDELAVSTSLEAGGASISARGRLTLKEAPGRGLGYDLAVAISDLEPSAILPGVPGSIRTGARGRLQGHGVVPESLEARFDGTIDPTVVLGYPVPDGEVHARFVDGRLEVERFEPRGGGLAGVLRGRVGIDGEVDIAARLQASDMRLVHGLEPVGGSGRCDVSLTGGAGRSFRLHGHGSARGLVLGPLRARSAEGQWDVRLPIAPGDGSPAPDLRMNVRASAMDASLAGVPMGAIDVNGTGDQISIRASGTSVRAERSVAVDAVVRPLAAEGGVEVSFARLQIGFRGRVFRGDGGIRVLPGRIEIRDLAVARADGARVEISGSVAPGRSVDLSARAARVDLAELWEIWSGARPPFEGRGDVYLAIGGPLPAPSVDLETRLGDVSFGGLQGLGIVADLSHSRDRLSGELQILTAGRQVISASLASLPVDPWGPGGPSFEVEGARSVRIVASDLPIEDVLGLARRLAPASVGPEVDFAGSISGSLELGGSWTEPSGTLTATVSSARWGAIDDLGLALQSEHGPQGLRLEAALSRNGRRIVGVAGSAGLEVERSRTRIFPSKAEILNEPVDLALAFGPVDQSALPAGWNTTPPIQAALSGRGTLRGSLADPVVEADLTLGGVGHEALPWRGTADGALHLSIAQGKIRVSGARFTKEGRPLVEVDGWADVEIGAREPSGLVAALGATARFPDLPLGWIRSLDGIAVGGRLALDVTASGSLRSPSLSARAIIRDLVVSGTRYHSAAASLSWDGAAFDSRASLRQSSGGTLALEAKLPMSWEPLRQGGPALLPEESSPVRGRIDAARFELEGLGGFVPGIAVMSGLVDAHVDVAGTRGLPTLRGSLGVSSGTFELADVGQRLEDISLVALLEPRRAVVSELRVRDRQGTAKATGSATLAGLMPTRFELEVEGRRFPVVREGLTLADVSGRVLVRGDATRGGIDATVTPRGLTIALPNRSARELQPLDDHPDVEVRSAFESRPAHQSASRAASRSPFLITALLDMASNVWLTRNDLALGFDGRVVVRYPWGRPLALQGSVSARRGFVTYGKNRFDLQRGDVTFTGEPGFNPLLDVDASYENPQATVSLHAGGRFSRPVLSFAAEGLSQTEIMMLLFFGQTELGGTTDDRTLAAQAQEQTQSLLTGLGISLLQQRAREAIPQWFPNIVIEQGTSGLDTTRVRAGAQLGSDVYLQGSANPGATAEENQYEIRGEWRVSRRWAIDTFVGDRGAGGVDFLWSYSY